MIIVRRRLSLISSITLSERHMRGVWCKTIPRSRRAVLRW
ncbi:Uncharacterised protein [Vibrio cholerae]|nr:Uncharacterised protein [Vibrio cholerae]